MNRPIRPPTPTESAGAEKQQASKAAKTGPATSTSKDASPSAAPRTGPEVDLTEWIAGQRWFARDGEDQPFQRRGTVELGTTPPVTVEVIDFGHDRQFQLLAWTEGQGDTDPDVAHDPVAAGALARFVTASGTAVGSDGSSVQATWLPDAAPPGDAPARPLGGEQSNTSVVIGGTHVLKLFRRVRPGVHPEVEVARHLASVNDDAGLPVADLAGWWELVQADGTTTALGVVQSFVPGALDGWSLVLSALAGDPGGALPRLHQLGRSLADLHAALAQPSSARSPFDDLATFGTQPFPADRATSIADATVGEAASLDLPDELLRSLEGSVRSAATVVAAAATEDAAGVIIRHHGDLHLGQVVWGDRGWVVLDFEGEPGRALPQRRARNTPLRDVAGMLRSLSYAVATHHRSGGVHLSDGWEPAARAAFLDGYLRQVTPALLPTSPVTTRALIALLETERVVYEISYERSHRPDWVDIPLGHLRTMTGDHR